MVLDAVPTPAVGQVRERAERAGMTEEQVAAVVARLKGGVADVVRVLWLCGARPSELCGLTVGQVVRVGAVTPRKGGGVSLAAAGVWAGAWPTCRTHRLRPTVRLPGIAGAD